MEGRSGSISAVAVSPDGRFVYIGSDDNTVKQYVAGQQMEASNGTVRAVRRCVCVCDVLGGAVAVADYEGALRRSPCVGCVARRSLCVFWKRRQNCEAVGGLRRRGGCR